jgi:hypothetical protein
MNLTCHEASRHRKSSALFTSIVGYISSDSTSCWRKTYSQSQICHFQTPLNAFILCGLRRHQEEIDRNGSVYSRLQDSYILFYQQSATSSPSFSAVRCWQKIYRRPSYNQLNRICGWLIRSPGVHLPFVSITSVPFDGAFNDEAFFYKVMLKIPSARLTLHSTKLFTKLKISREKKLLLRLPLRHS